MIDDGRRRDRQVNEGGEVKVKRALVSVSDKKDLEPFVRGLVELGVEVISTGGTARHLREAGLPITGISEVTGFPEIMDGRVKTLHPGHPRRHPGRPGSAQSPEGHRRTGHQAHRPGGGQPLSLRGDRRPARGERSRRHREHRHRRTLHGARRGQELRRGGDRHRSRRLRRTCWRSSRRTGASCRGRRGAGWPPRPSITPPTTTRPSPPGSASRKRISPSTSCSTWPRSRTCATARTRISGPPGTPRWARRGTGRRARAAARAAALVQQPARSGLRPPGAR